MELQSILNERLAAELRRNPGLAAHFDLFHESLPAFLHEYPYTVGPWPAFLNAQAVCDHFEPLIASVPQIMWRALDARFEHSKAMAAYFGWPEMFYHIMKDAPVDPRDLLLRYDAVPDSGGLKLLECNSGSTFGGWQCDFFHLQMRTRVAGLRSPTALTPATAMCCTRC